MKTKLLTLFRKWHFFALRVINSFEFPNRNLTFFLNGGSIIVFLWRMKEVFFDEPLLLLRSFHNRRPSSFSAHNALVFSLSLFLSAYVCVCVRERNRHTQTEGQSLSFFFTHTFSHTHVHAFISLSLSLILSLSHSLTHTHTHTHTHTRKHTFKFA